MDFLEGFLLGPIWSDTEYETRRHTGFYWLIGWVVLSIFSWFVLFPEQTEHWLIISYTVSVVVLIVLLLGSPFISRFYYRMNLIIKVIILIIQTSKFSLAFVMAMHIGLKRLQVNREMIPQDLLEYVNQTMANASLYFESWGKGVGMLLGIVSGGIIIVLTLVGGLLLATLIPVVILIAVKTIQRLIDLLACRILFQELD